MLRGNSPAKVDDKGRIKIPTLFRRYIEETWGRDFFVTSLSGAHVRVYPMPIWADIEKKLASVPSMDPAIARFRNLVNYFGQEATMDDQGRLLIHPLLRQRARIDGDVAVIGNQNCLDIWNRDRFEADLALLSDDDRKVIAGLGI